MVGIHAGPMLKSGWATVYVFEAPFERLSSFQSAESAAKRAGRGAWTACDGEFPRLA
jgi:endonuclease YncB( thermonuclease family)